jgi:predicted nucleic acid-binding protein
MIRVVIDTNVLVSALLTSGGLPEAVINLALSGGGLPPNRFSPSTRMY